MHNHVVHSQALTAPPSLSGLTDMGTPGLQLAVACAASVYFLRENKRLGLGEVHSTPDYQNRTLRTAVHGRLCGGCPAALPARPTWRPEFVLRLHGLRQ